MYAAKLFRLGKSLRNRSHTNFVRKEITSLTELHHQNILRLVGTVLQDTMDKLYLVLELAPEGDLFGLVVMRKKLREQETRKVFALLFPALTFMVSDP